MASQNVELSRALLTEIEENNIKNLNVTRKKYIPTLEFLKELNLDYSEDELKKYSKKIGRYIYVFDLSKNNITWT